MKKTALFIGGILVLAACGCSSDDKSTTIPANSDTSSLTDSLRQALADQDSLLVLLTELSEGMDNIKRLEGDLAGIDLGDETTNRRQRIRNDMAAIQQALANRRARLAELEQRLAKSNSNNANLRRAIASLKNQIAQQETTIESLRADLSAANIYIDRLSADRDSLTATVAATEQERNEVILENIDLTNELNICYYAIGSKKELKDHRIISTGFLKKTKIMPQDFEHSYFTVADKRYLTSIPLHSRKAELMTNQPTSSYNFSTDDSGNKVLNITDPKMFWSVSNYMVVKID